MTIENNEDLQSIVQSAPIGICILDAATLVTEMVNDAFLEVAGKPREAIYGKYYWDSFKEAAPYYEAALANVVKEGVTYRADEVELMLIRNGQEEWVFVTFVYEPVKDKTGAVQKVAIWVLENTLQVKSRQSVQQLNEELTVTNEELLMANEEQAVTNEELVKSADDLSALNTQLQNSENRFRSLVEQIPAAINVFLTEDLIVDLPNDRMLEIWGRTLDEVSGKPLATAMPELEGQPFMQKLRDVIATGVFYSSSEEKAFIQRNGELEECYFNIIYQPIVNEDGTITSCLQIASEVTEEVMSRKKIQALNEELSTTNEELAATNEELSAANEELIQSQNDYIEVYNQLLKKGEDLVFTIDAASLATFDLNPVTGLFTGNDLLMAWYGLEPGGEIDMQTGINIISKEDYTRVVNALNEALRFSSGGTYDVEYTLINPKDPTPRVLRAKGKTKFDENNQPVRLSGIAQDITEQKRDEQRKNDFIGMVSHEMKTPLTSLSGYLQLLMMNNNKGDAASANMLGKASKQVSKMTTLINGFLNVSRLESGKIQINKQHFDMADLVKEAEEETRALYNSHEFIFHPVEETIVNADRDKIGQVINNLISNAVKYSSSGSPIHIACITLAGMAQVSVKDKGIGIREEDKDKLFDRYYRVNNDNSTSVSGFGIGLYLCAEIIHRHDGKIWVDSKAGKGSTFFFSLPVESR